MPKKSSTFERYGDTWDSRLNDLEVELLSIARGGTWYLGNKICGADTTSTWKSLFKHYMNARVLLWPDRYRHRWTDLMYENFIRNQVTILMGAGSSQKTSHACEFALISYWARPTNTMVLLSTMNVEKLDSAIFGEIKMLFNHARENFPDLPGHLVDSRRMICTDDIEQNTFRDVRRGILGKACYVGHRYVGLGVYAGMKQQYVIFIADELQFMPPTFLDCLPNMFTNPNVKVIGSGNPKHDPTDQLSIAACPRAGYESLGEIEKTTVWDIKFERGKCINLVGTDSPNYDFPASEPIRYPGLTNRETARRVEAFWTKDSLQYWSQVKGVMKIGMIGNRIITEQLCRAHRAHDIAIWAGTNRFKIYAIDIGWGGLDADRCPRIILEVGEDIDGVQIISVGDPVNIPINPALPIDAEDQIAQFVKRDATANNVPVTNIFYDATGQGTMGSAFARVFGHVTPVPVEFGGSPSLRPVRHDLFVADEKTHTKRLKRCDEHYRKFVTELWFSVRYVIECDQMRQLSREIMHEGCMREYGEVMGKIEVEKKEDTKERMGFSPDLFDALATGVEGARQRGFKIQRLGANIVENAPGDDEEWAAEEQEYEDALKSKLLVHA